MKAYRFFQLLHNAADSNAGGAGGDDQAGGDGKAADSKAADGKGADDKAADAGKGDTGDSAKKDGDGKGSDDKSADGADAAGKASSDNKGATDGDGKAKAGAPDKYELRLPTDQDVLSEADLAGIEVIARGKNWTNEQAQAAVAEHVAAIKEQSQRFLDETKADPVYGGQNLEHTQRLATKGLDRIAPKGDKYGAMFRRLISGHGVGNNLAVLATLARIGKMTADDSSFDTGHGSSSNAGKTDAEKLYGDNAS